MNCEQCRNKILDYIEGNLSEELDVEMKKHISNCEECQKLYKKELLVDKSFNDVFNIDGINFKSSKNAIMNSIDKNKYGKGTGRGYKGKDFYKKLATVAAAVFLLAFVTPLAFRSFDTKKSDTAISGKQASENNKATTDSAKENTALKSDQSQVTAQNSSNEKKLVDLYEKTEVPIETKLEFSTKWIASDNKTFEASLEGKGPNAEEEGVATLYVKDNTKKTMYKYTFKDNSRQTTPLSVAWYDDDNIMIVNGSANGTLINGLQVEVLSIGRDKEYAVYEPDNPKERIKSVSKDNSRIKVTRALYDDAINNYTEEDKFIDYKVD